MTSGTYQNGKSIAEALNDLKVEIKDFLQTRYEMLRSELGEKAAAWKVGLPTLAIGALFSVMSMLAFTGALVCVIALAFYGSPYNYLIAFVIVFAVYLALGAILLLFGVRRISEEGIAPEKTIRVLKQDQVWLATEAKTQI